MLNVWLSLVTLRSWPKHKSRVKQFNNWATQAPLFMLFLYHDDAWLKFCGIIEYNFFAQSICEAIWA